MAQISLRELTPDDAEFIRSMLDNDDYDAIFFEKGTTTAMWRERIKRMLARGGEHYIIVDSENGGRAGWISYRLSAEDKTCALDILVIKIELAGKAYGTAAMNLLVERIKGIAAKIELDVLASNERALSFYKKNGFYVTGEKTLETRDGEARFLCMECFA